MSKHQTSIKIITSSSSSSYMTHRLRTIARHFTTMEMAPVTFTRHSNTCLETTLTRPSKLNSLNLEMVRIMTPVYQELRDQLVILNGTGNKAFCAGGDIASIRQDFLEGGTMVQDFFYEEYVLDYTIAKMQERQNVTQVALWDGITMGGGVGISVHGAYRVATDKTMFAMPETAIGLIPDVGVTHTLSRLRCPASAMYIALTGARFGGHDCHRLGFATHFIPSEHIPELTEQLRRCPLNDVQGLLDSFQKNCATGDDKTTFLEKYQSSIVKCFSSDSLEEIFANIRAHADGEWKTTTLKSLESASPLAMKLTFEAVKAHSKKTIGQAFSEEYRIVQRACGDDGDFFEGVRALLIDKCKNPKWKHNSISELSPDYIARFFEPLPSDHIRGDLVLE